MSDYQDYFNYLRGRSRLGLLYRKFWLYPRLNKYLYGRVLDIGCGVGDLLGFRPGTVGVDVNPVAVEWCRSNGYDAHVMSHDVLPFDDVSFDCVVLDNVLEHIESPGALLSEIFRVIGQDGNFLVGVPGHRGYDSDSDHKIFYDESALILVMQSAQFGLKKIFHTPIRSAWLDKKMRQYCVYGVFSRG